MALAFDHANIASVSDFLRILKTERADERKLWYRGQADSSWTLTPSLARRNGVAIEMELITRFRQNAITVLPPRAFSPWEWMLYMQHFQVPTRLLDWSENPLVGLYFAVVDDASPDTDACVWCLDPRGLNTFARIGPDVGRGIPCLDVDSELNAYLPQSVALGPAIKRPPIAVLAMRIFQRLSAQAGVFTVSHRDFMPVETIEAGKHIGRIRISGAARPTLAKELTLLGVTRLALYPELQSVASVTNALLP